MIDHLQVAAKIVIAKNGNLIEATDSVDTQVDISKNISIDPEPGFFKRVRTAYRVYRLLG